MIGRLPQKRPFLFIDHVLVHEPLVRAAGEVAFPADHPIFESHLPGDPIVPGVILIEAAAQLSGIVLLARDGAGPVRGYLAGVEGARFRRLVRPGERVVLESRLERRFGSAAAFEVSASVGDALVMGGRLTIGGVVSS